MGMHEMDRIGVGRKIMLCLGAVTVVLFVLATAVPTARAGTASGWNIIPSPNTGSTSSDLLVDTTCTSTWSCWAVGGSFSELGNNSQPHAISDRWNGSTWSAGPDISPAG